MDAVIVCAGFDEEPRPATQACNAPVPACGKEEARDKSRAIDDQSDGIAGGGTR
jgi:hypothetical protein